MSQVKSKQLKRNVYNNNCGRLETVRLAHELFTSRIFYCYKLQSLIDITIEARLNYTELIVMRASPLQAMIDFMRSNGACRGFLADYQQMRQRAKHFSLRILPRATSLASILPRFVFIHKIGSVTTSRKRWQRCKLTFPFLTYLNPHSALIDGVEMKNVFKRSSWQIQIRSRSRRTFTRKVDEFS